MLFYSDALAVRHAFVAVGLSIAACYARAIGCAIDGIELFFQFLVVAVFAARTEAETKAKNHGQRSENAFHGAIFKPPQKTLPPCCRTIR